MWLRNSLNDDWLVHIGGEFDKPYMKELATFLEQEREADEIIYPASDLIFNAMNMTPFDRVRVVILGQDPYHGPDQAHGLSFSVRSGIKLPPSLLNIYKEIASEYDVPLCRDGDLTRWAKQGVLLLNATLTVRQAQAGSHQNKGWETFTDQVIKAVNDHSQHVVFLLWGSYAQKKIAMIDTNKHSVLAAPHPSPLSAHRGFFGCNHFRLANDYLCRNGFSAIDWVGH